MRYNLTKKFGVKRSDSKNWVVFEEVDRINQETGETYKDDKILGYFGDIFAAYRMAIKLIPSYAGDKGELADTIKELKELDIKTLDFKTNE